jgi:hypothetical protein
MLDLRTLKDIRRYLAAAVLQKPLGPGNLCEAVLLLVEIEPLKIAAHADQTLRPRRVKVLRRRDTKTLHPAGRARRRARSG